MFSNLPLPGLFPRVVSAVSNFKDMSLSERERAGSVTAQYKISGFSVFLIEYSALYMQVCLLGSG
jgi:hypothetical protein